MRNARSYILPVLTTVLSATIIAALIVASWDWLSSQGTTTRVLAITVGAGAILGAGACFALTAMHRQLARLGFAIEDASQSGSDHAVAVAPWLLPIAESMSQTARSAEARNAALTARMREMEVRSRLSEVERAHTEAILDSLRDAVLVTDSFQEVTASHTRAEELLGITDNGTERAHIRDILGTTDIDGVIGEVLSSGMPNVSRHLERHMNTPSGEGVFDITLATLPAAGAEGEKAAHALPNSPRVA